MPEKDPGFWFWVASFFAAISASLVAYFHNLKKLNAKFAWLDFVLRIGMGVVVGLLATGFSIGLEYNQYFSGAMAGVAGMFSEHLVKWVEKFIDAWFGSQIRSQDD